MRSKLRHGPRILVTDFRSLTWALVTLLILMGGIAQAQSLRGLQADRSWVERELRRMELPSAFVKLAVAQYERDSFETVLRLNLLGFLNPPQHMNLVTPEAVKEAAKFLKTHQKDFAKAQQTYQVSPDVIAALLWVETRHGDNLGGFHTLSVFLHLLQADRRRNREQLTWMALAQNQGKKGRTKSEIKELIPVRTKRKAEWAREELRALASIFKKNQLDLKTLKGSYAGAFGMAQFIPTSYRDYAKAARPKGRPDLMKSSDAIMSVAHYLSRHGWQKKKSKTKVLMTYNNSEDYAESILEISKRVSSRRPATPIAREPLARKEKG